MKHFRLDDWVDFVRSCVEAEKQASMKSHLSECSRCVALATLLRNVVSAAARNDERSIPEHETHMAKTLFLLQPLNAVEIQRGRCGLLFDSFREPLPAGMRSLGRISRHIVYEGGKYCVDLRHEYDENTRLTRLVGQISDRTEPRSGVVGTPVLLMSGKQIVARQSTNEFGEFQMEYALIPNLRLVVPMERGQPEG